MFEVAYWRALKEAVRKGGKGDATYFLTFME
jgi:hypothetical protein